MPINRIKDVIAVEIDEPCPGCVIARRERREAEWLLALAAERERKADAKLADAEARLRLVEWHERWARAWCFVGVGAASASFGCLLVRWFS